LTSPRQARVEFDASAPPPPPPSEISGAASPPAPPYGGTGPGPRKPRVAFDGKDPPTPRSATEDFLSGLDGGSGSGSGPAEDISEVSAKDEKEKEAGPLSGAMP